MYIYAYVKQVIATSYFETVDNISCLSCSYFKANSIVITFINFFNVKKSTTFHSHPVNCFVKNVFVIFFSVFFFSFFNWNICHNLHLVQEALCTYMFLC